LLTPSSFTKDTQNSGSDLHCPSLPDKIKHFKLIPKEIDKDHERKDISIYNIISPIKHRVLSIQQKNSTNFATDTHGQEIFWKSFQI